VLVLSRNRKNKEARARYVGEANSSGLALSDALKAEADLQTRTGETLAAESQQDYAKIRSILMFMLLVCAFGGAAAAFFVVRGLNQALRQAVTELSEGAN
jgi:hypothetical protein